MRHVFLPPPQLKHIFTYTHAGIILSSVLHTVAGRSPFLLVLDARNFEEIVRVEFQGVDIPKGLHGVYYENGGGGPNMIEKLEGIVVWCKTNVVMMLYYVSIMSMYIGWVTWIVPTLGPN